MSSCNGSNQKSNRNQKKRSLVWNHFSKVGNTTSRCVHCLKCISVSGGSIGNLLRHIKRKHPSIEVNVSESKHANNTKFIHMVSQRKSIWDPKNRDYNNTQISNHLWDEVCQEMSITREMADTIWKDLTASFKIEHRKCLMSEINNADIPYKSKWVDYNALKFLEPLVTTELLKENMITMSDIMTEVVTSADRHFSTVEMITPVHHCEVNCEKYSPVELIASNEQLCRDDQPNKRTFETADGNYKIKVSSNNGAPPTPSIVVRNNNCRNSMRELTSPTIMKQLKVEEIDEDVGFLNSLLPHMRKFSNVDKFRVRNEINSIILRYINDANDDNDNQSDRRLTR